MDLTTIGRVAEPMAKKIIEKGMEDLTEVWGSEVTVYYPGLYAGATDLAGIYDYSESIIDFKQSNKPKRREWIDDYFMQLGAYAMAHNYCLWNQDRSGCNFDVHARLLFPEVCHSWQGICKTSTQLFKEVRSIL